ncbi:MAG TPA: hypothetical protein VKD69_12630 [Vicinamibacterales bacterium]|nr:hypothetical protein [Vicinamibacterales bacterium]
MMIDASKSQIFERPGTERGDQLIARLGRSHVAARDLFEQILQLFV